ncbi:MAG: hypothetical protein ACW98X_26050, partial [Promethearchaeota archaeon]
NAEGEINNDYRLLRPTTGTPKTVKKKVAPTRPYDPVLDNPAYTTTPSETINKVATDYLGGPDLKTVSTQAMIKQAQDAEKKEAVAQHFYAEMKKEFPGYTIEEARANVNKPGKDSFLGTLLGVDDNIGAFAWEDYYNRERLWDEGPDTMRGISDAEWDAEHSPQPWQDKFKDIMYNPFTSAGFWVRGQEIPDYMQRDMDRGTFGQYMNGAYVTGRNPLDLVTDITPIGALHSADRIIEKAGNDISGDFWTMETGLDALNAVFHANMLNKATKFAPPVSYMDDLAGAQAANYATRNRILAGDADLLNTGFKPLQKTLGSADEVVALSDNTAGFLGEKTPRAASMEDWINENGPQFANSLKNIKLRKKSTSKTSTETTPGTGTHEERAIQRIVNDAIKDMPFQGVKEHPFAGTNLMTPLNIQTGVSAPIYKLPEGISQLQLDSFVSQINAGEVPVTSVEAVFRVLAKLNPELNSIKNVPKEDIIGYMSGHMPIDEIESTHKFMSNSNPDPSSLSNVYKTTRKIKEAPDKFINLLKRKFPAEKNLMNAQQERFDKAIKFTKDWYLDPEEVSKLQSGIPAWNARVHDYLTEGTELGEFRSPNDLASEYPTAKILRPDIAEKIDFINSFKSKDLLENQYISPSYTPGEELMRSTDKLVSRFQIKDKTTPFGKMLKESLPNQRGINLNSSFGNTGITYADSPSGKLYNPDAVAATGSHELGHSAQKIQEWSKVITKYDPEFGYYVPNTDTELGKRFAEAMVEPAPLSELEKLAGQPYSHKTWLSSPDELHSDLNPLREATYQNFMQRGDHTAEEIMNFLKNPPDELIDTWLKAGGLNNHFK